MWGLVALVFFFKKNADRCGGQGDSPVGTLPETNIMAPENGRLEDDPFLLGWLIFRDKLAVSFRECSLYFPGQFVAVVLGLVQPPGLSDEG